MNRRNAVKTASVLAGGIWSLPFLEVLLDGCDRASKPGTGNTFTEEENKMIARMADIVIPATTTPGALDTGVPAFVMMMMQQCYDINAQQAFHKGLIAFDQLCKQQYSKSFLDLNPEKQVLALKYLDHLILGKKQDANTKDQDLNFYHNFKALVISGFYTSQEGATKVLRYLPVPGHFSGCVPYHRGDREWAT